MNQTNFKPFIDDLLSQGFEQFVTLYFPGPRPLWTYENDLELLKEALRDLTDETRRAARRRLFDRAQTCHERWLAEVEREAPLTHIRQITVIESRAGRRDFMFHALLGGCDWGEVDFDDKWAPRWNEISGGKAFIRQIDGRIGGLLRHFVFKKNCVLDINCGSVHGRFTAEDFEKRNRY
jgi:hypothetical protein